LRILTEHAEGRERFFHRSSVTGAVGFVDLERCNRRSRRPDRCQSWEAAMARRQRSEGARLSLSRLQHRRLPTLRT